MELPHIGEQCSESSCRQLDFLPFTCSLCKKIFCLQHHKIDAHVCPKSGTVDVRIPVCPLCDQAVPAQRGMLPDIAISEHLDNNCVVKKNNIFKNKCSFKGCKKKELMPVLCRECNLNYCIPHRHPNDHKCERKDLSKPTLPSPRNGSVLQALRDGASNRLGFGQNQQQQPARSRPNNEKLTQLQGNMSEDEALALALSQSEQEEANKKWQRDNRRTAATGNSSKDSCHLS